MSDSNILRILAGIFIAACLYFFFGKSLTSDLKSQGPITQTQEQLNAPKTQVINPTEIPRPSVQPLAGSSGIEAEILETEKCKTMPRKAIEYVRMPSRQLKRLHANAGPVFRGVLLQDRCWFVGQKLVLTLDVTAVDGTKFWVQSASGELQKIFSETEAEMLVRDFTLGIAPGHLAEVCQDFCDDIIQEADSNLAKTHRTLVFLPATDPRRPPLPSATYFEFEPQTVWANQFAASFEPIKDQSFIIVTDIPISLRGPNLVKVMKYLKLKGAKQVLWLFAGIQSFEQGPIRPSAAGFAEIVRFANLTQNPIPSAQYIFATDASNSLQHQNAFSNSMIVNSRWSNIKFAKPISDLDLDFYSTDEQILFPKGVKLDIDSPVVVYGQSIWSWHPIFVLRNLHKKGFKKLYWMQGGNSEALQWREIEKLGTLPKSN